MGIKVLTLGSNSMDGQHQFETWTMVGFRDGDEGDREE